MAPLRNQTFFSPGELREAIQPLPAALNERPFKKLEGSRRNWFKDLDRPALKPLPVERYDYAQWRKTRVNIDYHIQVEHAMYQRSPRAAQLRGRRSDHAPTPSRASASPATSPPDADWSPSRLLAWGRPWVPIVPTRVFEGRVPADPRGSHWLDCASGLDHQPDLARSGASPPALQGGALRPHPPQAVLRWRREMPTTMKHAEHTSPPAFENARMLGEGSFATPQGNMVHTNYVDLSGKHPPDELSLVKVSEPQFHLRVADFVRLSRPSVFRETGEALVKDEQEGRAARSTSETIESPAGETARMDRRLRAIRAGLGLSHTTLSVSGTATSRTTNTSERSLTFGGDWLVYCTSLLHAVGEEDAWRRTFPENYTSVARIHRPTQFAQGLGLAVCEHIGATGKPGPVKASFHGFKTFEVHRTPQRTRGGSMSGRWRTGVEGCRTRCQLPRRPWTGVSHGLSWNTRSRAIPPSVALRYVPIGSQIRSRRI